MLRDDLSAQAGTGQARLAVIRATRPRRITKRFERGTNGELVKLPGGPLVEGRAEIRTVDGLGDLTELLLSLGPDEALTFGVPTGGDGVLVTRRAFERQGRLAGTMPRTSDHFGWPSGPGILMLDHDPAPGEAAIGREALVAALRDAAPGLARVAMLWWPSASSHVSDTATGAELTGLRGQRIYILVRDARDIPRAGAALVERLWAAGHGRILVSASGAALDRTLVDASVWQPERLDFAAGADCGPGLRQDRGRPVQIEGTTE